MINNYLIFPFLNFLLCDTFMHSLVFLSGNIKISNFNHQGHKGLTKVNNLNINILYQNTLPAKY